MPRPKALAFDWRAFCDRHGVHYVDHGPNVARGYIGIQCPFCGAADHSQHLGLSLDNSWWGCFRNQRHRAARPERLIVALIRCSWAEAKAMVEEGSEVAPSSIAALRERLIETEEVETSLPTVNYPKEFRKIKRGDPFAEYLKDRGFWKIRELCQRYDLRCARVGDQAHRVILPVFDGGLRGWTGRAIGKSRIRYNAWPTDGSLHRCIFNADSCAEGGEVLLVCEGPLDVLKMDHAGQARGVRACGVMGLSLGGARAARLFELGKRYRRIGILLDRPAEARSMEFLASLRASGLLIQRDQLPIGFSDPGELFRTPAEEFITEILAA